MEKMNQVSVTEFMSKSKEEMYDNAVEMVEKYNRLADICNDSSERISELVIERNYLVEKHNTYTHSLNADIAAKDAKIELMQKELDGRKAGYVALKAQMDTKYISIEEHNDICKTYEINNESLKNQVEYLKKELDQTCTCKELDLKGHQSREMALVNTLADKNDEIKELKEENSRLNARIKCDTEYWKKAFEAQSVPLADEMKLNESLRKTNDELVDTLNKSNARIEELEEENFKLSGHVDTDFINKLIQETDYYKEQERIRTDQLRATESKVEELWKRIEGLKRANRIAVNSVYGIASASIREEDDHGRAGFKKYIEWLIEEEERAVPDRFKARLNEEITEIFEKEEETEVKGVGRTSSGRYPWGAKIIRCEKPDNFHCIYGDDCSVEAMEKCKFAKELKSDIPCGEDSIE